MFIEETGVNAKTKQETKARNYEDGIGEKPKKMRTAEVKALLTRGVEQDTKDPDARSRRFILHEETKQNGQKRTHTRLEYYRSPKSKDGEKIEVFIIRTVLEGSVNGPKWKTTSEFYDHEGVLKFTVEREYAERDEKSDARNVKTERSFETGSKIPFREKILFERTSQNGIPQEVFRFAMRDRASGERVSLEQEHSMLKTGVKSITEFNTGDKGLNNGEDGVAEKHFGNKLQQVKEALHRRLGKTSCPENDTENETDSNGFYSSI